MVMVRFIAHLSHNRRLLSLIAGVALSAFGLGCNHPSKPANIAQFAFITTNTTLQDVIDRLGKYDRVRGSGILWYEYDLPDGSAVLITPSLRGPSRLVVNFVRSANTLTNLYP
jgi:hypothetical protein